MVNEYMSAEAAEASSPFASGGGVGSPDWWSSEISGREAAAAANTESTPTPSERTMSEVYTDPRTGQNYANQAQFLAAYPSGVSTPEWSTPGVPVKTPTGETFYSRYSQYWMDPAYTGPEPSLSEKAVYSGADYARDFAGALMTQYGQSAAPAVQAKAAVYKSASATPSAQAAEDLFAAGEDLASQGLTWLKNNLLIVVIVIAGIFVLPRVIDAAVPTRRR